VIGVGTTAHARVSLAGLLLAAILMPSQSHAEFRGKGSIVGRILSESVAEAESPEAKSPAPSKDAAKESETETERPISRDALNALMKHPTEPDYDPLRPMSGRWVRCQTNSSGEVPGVKSQQDRYSSSDRSHFTHTISRASDLDCKTVVSQDRATYECSSADKKTLSCKVTKRETRAGGGAWSPVKLGGNEKSIKLSFAGAEKKTKKKRTKARDPRKLEARINDEPVLLEFEPSNPHVHKTND
jgi:hypothetical protein